MDILSAVIYLAGNAFRICVIYMFLKAFFPGKLTPVRKYGRYAAFAVFFMIISFEYLYLQCSSAVVLVSNIAGMLMLSLLYQGRVKYKVLIAMGVFVMELICEDATYAMLLRLNSEHVVMMGIIISNLIFFIIVLVVQKVFDYRKGESVSVYEWILLMIIPAVSVILSAVVIDNCTDIKIIAIGGLSLLCLNVFSFYLINHIIKLQRVYYDSQLLEQQCDAYKQQVNLLMVSEKNFASLKHDMNNHLLALYRMADNEESLRIKSYLNELTENMKPGHQYVSTGNDIIDGILNSKFSIAANDLGVIPDFDVDISGELGIAESDLCVIMGNLLDNSLDALRACSDERKLVVAMNEDCDLICIKVSNTYNGHIDHINGRFFSTKSDNDMHGIGLRNIKHCVDKYHGQMDINYTDNVFSVKIILYTK